MLKYRADVVSAGSLSRYRFRKFRFTAKNHFAMLRNPIFKRSVMVAQFTSSSSMPHCKK